MSHIATSEFTNSLIINKILNERYQLDSVEESEYIPITSILFLQSSKNYTKFHLNDNRFKLSSNNLKYHEMNLPKEFFFRIHHSFLINILHLSIIKKKGSLLAIMSSGDSIPISFRRKKDILTEINQSIIIRNKTLIL